MSRIVEVRRSVDKNGRVTPKHTREVTDKPAANTHESEATLTHGLTPGVSAPHTVKSALAELEKIRKTGTDDQLATLAAAGVTAAIHEAVAEIPELAHAASVVLEDTSNDGGAPYYGVRAIRDAAGEIIWTPPAKPLDETDDSEDAVLADNIFPQFVPLLDKRRGRLRQEETDVLGNRSWRLQLGANPDKVTDEGRDAIYDALTTDNSGAKLRALEDVAGLLNIRYGDEDAPREASAGRRRIQDALEGGGAYAVHDALVLVASAGNIDYTDYNAAEDDDYDDDEDEIED